MTGFEPLIAAATAGLTSLITETIKARGGKLLERLDRDLPRLEKASQQYIENYRKRHGKLKVVCVRMDNPVELDSIYTAVQVLDRSDLRYFESAATLQDLFRQTSKRGFEFRNSRKQDGIRVASQNQYLMVLGGPGVGKSTFLRKMGLEALKVQKEQVKQTHIPVFLQLKQFSSNQLKIEEFIAQEFVDCGFPEAEAATQVLLEQGKLLILLDGLDEVPTDNLDYAITQIQKLADRYSQNRFITSCRIAAYKGGFDHFKDVVIAAFEDEQIEQFIYNWFRSEGDQTVNTAEQCWQLLKRSEYAAAKELAQTPLLLTLLCMIYDESLDFPKNRSAVYGEALDVLLKKWAAEKRIQRDPIYRELSSELEQILLAEIAYTSFAADQLFFSKQEIIEKVKDFLINNLNAPKHLDGEAVLDAIEVQQGILVERARDAYSFSHLTLQEYLTAQYIDAHREIEVKQLVAKHLVDQRWQEVFLLVAGQMRGGADELLLLMEKQAQAYLNTPKLKALLQWADHATTDSEGQLKPVAKRTTAIFLALKLARQLVDDKQGIDLTQEVALALALDFNIDHDFARILDLSSTLDLVCALQIVNIFKGVNFNILATQLKSQKIETLNRNQFAEEQHSFAQQVLNTWFDLLNLKQELIELSLVEVEALESYLYANWLMVQSKQAALSVSPETWEGIEERMLKVNN